MEAEARTSTISRSPPAGRDLLFVAESIDHLRVLGKVSGVVMARTARAQLRPWDQALPSGYCPERIDLRCQARHVLDSEAVRDEPGSAERVVQVLVA